MKRLTLLVFAVFLILSLAACNNSAPVTVTVETTRLVTQQVPVTVQVPATVIVYQTVPVPVTVIVTPTFTPGPSPTPTITPTPTSSPTPTPSPTPFRVGNCLDFKLNYTATTTAENLIEQLKRFDGRCVKVLYIPGEGKYTVDMLLSNSNMGILTDKQSPPIPKNPAYIYGIYYMRGTEKNPDKNDKILLRRVDVLPSNQRPILSEGRYTVGKDGQMSPGIWKSAQLPTDTDSCYWARLNPNSGDIRDNHFGIGGITVRIYAGDIFETNANCLPWVYLGP